MRKKKVPGTLEWSVLWGRVWVIRGAEQWAIKDLGLEAITGTAEAEHRFLKDPWRQSPEPVRLGHTGAQ